MHRQTTAGGIERNPIGDEAVFLRIRQLQTGLLQFTDSTNAYRLVKEFGKDIRYIAPWKKWLVWDGSHWQADSGALIHAKGLEMVRNIYSEIYKTADYRDRLDIEKYAIQSESVRRRKAFVEAASWIPDLNAAVDDLDRNPWLLNAENGTIDLRTGELLPRQEDMITKIAKVRYDKNAGCPKWKQFIREIMDCKEDLITFLQTAAGWAVSGDISEQSMFILYGTGANGKSTFLEGALRWHKEGLNTPSVVLNATDEYRGEMDVIGNFIRERCVQKPGAAVRARELFRVYQKWCEENNEQATSERMFGMRMKELGMVQKRTADARYWQDVAVQV